jgi:hypothetical protein
MLRVVCAALLVLALAVPAVAQSTAANGSIEGTVVDTSGGVLPGVTVTVTNIDTGLQRAIVTNAAGLFRAPLLPLGTYKVVAELEGFKKYEEAGIKLSVGQTAVVKIAMGVGALTETVTVNAADKPALELARIDIGHTMTDQEVHSLPLVARNPYNYALVQPGVTGTENVEFGVPRLAANGAAMRINYQIDGNTNTEKDRAGLRLLPMSEVMIQEVKVVTTGFAPEFGQTMGMVYNAVTPSGTNNFHGQTSYLFRRNGFSAFPFFFGCGSTTVAANCPGLQPTAVKPATKVDTYTGNVGGPILRNKLFFYTGIERTRRDLSSTSLITVSPDVVAAAGLKAQPSAAPNVQTAKFFIGKADYQISNSHRATLRWVKFQNDAPYNSGGGTATLERATNFLDSMNSVAGQVISTFGSNLLNEFRVQWAGRHQQSVANSDSGTGPAVAIASPALSFGGPWAATGQGNAGFDFKQQITQVIDNFTLVRSKHSIKFGFDIQHIYDARIAAPQFLYSFSTLAAYLQAKAGTNPYSYSTMSQLTGDRSFTMATNVMSFFAQDDWQLAPSVKLLYGVRYDLYKYPNGLANAPLAQTKSFNIDKNNFGPRVGVAWALNPKTMVRASTGIMFDQPILGGYEQALQLSGSPKAPVYQYNGTTPGAPAFPSGISSGTLAVQSPWAIDPSFEVAHTWQSNVQLEHAFRNDWSVSVGVMYARGNQLPVVTDINLINPTGTLADGRPTYSTTVSATTRADARFNHINEVQSIGESTFKALTLQTTKRFAQGLTFNVQYQLGKGLDNTPLRTELTVQSEAGRSDPSNLDRDKGPNPLDMRHNFTGNIVYTTSSKSKNAVVRQLLTGNEFGVLLQFNSGLPVNILANRDLNGDGVSSDRPLNVSRNPMYYPVRKNMDMRYTRWVPVARGVRGEIIAEVKNLLNTRQMSGLNTTRTVDTAGNLVDSTGALTQLPTDPYQFLNPSGFEQRKFQLGFRVRF